MGMHDCIMRWAPYLQTGEFHVIVDHKALQHIYSFPKTTANRRILRYALNLQKFTFSVYYKEGAKHLNADAMSRLYQYGDELEDVDEEEAGNFDIVTQDDIDLLKAKVKLDTETGLTMVPSALIKAAAKELATAKAVKVSSTRASSLAWRMSQDEEFMGLSTGGPLNDTRTADQLDCKQQTYNANVRRVVNDDRIWEDQAELYYVNLLWQGADGEEANGDEPTQIYTINRLTGDTELKSLSSQHESKCNECDIRSTQVLNYTEEGLCGICDVRYGTRSKENGGETKTLGRHGSIPVDISQTSPTINIQAKVKKNLLVAARQRDLVTQTELKKAVERDERLALKVTKMAQRAEDQEKLILLK